MSLIRARYRAVNTVMNLGATGPTLLLDLYPNAAAAYSLRKLREAYSGAAIRVRESGGNTEADIGFTSAGDLDTAALLAHCGANDGLIVTWYDQSLSNDATQATAASQPKIVSAGSLVTENGKAAISGTLKELNVSSATLQDTFDIFSICNIDTECYIADMRGGDVNGNMILGRRSVGWLFNGSSWLGNGSSVSTATQILANFEISTTSATYHENGVSVETISHSVNTSTNQGFDIDFLNGHTLKIQELIAFNSDQSSNRTGIETNINNFYSIYP